MNKIQLVGLVLLYTTGASALELELYKSRHVADANYCGDINGIATFKIKKFGKGDKSASSFHPNARNLPVIAEAVQKEYGLENVDFAIVAQYEKSIVMLMHDFGLQTEHGRHFLTSCHDMEVLSWFDLEVAHDQLAVKDSGQPTHYFTLGGGRNPVYSEFTVHVFVNLKTKTLKTFLAW